MPKVDLQTNQKCSDLIDALLTGSFTLMFGKMNSEKRNTPKQANTW